MKSGKLVVLLALIATPALAGPFEGFSKPGVNKEDKTCTNFDGIWIREACTKNGVPNNSAGDEQLVLQQWGCDSLAMPLGGDHFKYSLDGATTETNSNFGVSTTMTVATTWHGERTQLFGKISYTVVIMDPEHSSTGAATGIFSFKFVDGKLVYSGKVDSSESICTYTRKAN